MKENAPVDVEHLAGHAVRAAERGHLIRHVLHARRALDHGALSGRPTWPTAASTAAGMAPGSVWSGATLPAFRPSASTAAHVSRAASLRSRYVMPTCAPAFARARAIAMPSTPVPPATSATRSLRSMAA